MFAQPLRLVVALGIFAFAASSALAQMAGTRGGVEREQADPASLPALEPKVAEGYITVDGRAEVRVVPTEVRMVLAVTSEAETAPKCQQAIDQSIRKLKDAWSAKGIAADKTVVDFIAVLPRYQWSTEEKGSRPIQVEKRIGYRMQTNVHVAAKGEDEARKALDIALDQGVTDIIAFDYWSKELDEVKLKVRAEAVKAAKAKADVLLAAVFAQRPPAINVQERTVVRYPDSMYHSVVNVADEEGSGYAGHFSREIPFIRSYRPKNTYYRGLLIDGDSQPRDLAMKPEISVISTVRIYYKSPAADWRKDAPAAKPDAPR